jgi:hypothetical protein
MRGKPRGQTTCQGSDCPRPTRRLASILNAGAQFLEAVKPLARCVFFENMTSMARREYYKRLEKHLRADGRSRIEMTFGEVTRVIGVDELPGSAYDHAA